MFVGEGELRDAAVQRPRLDSFVDARVQVDVVPARRPQYAEDDLRVAAGVEAAGVARIGVVVGDVVDVGGLGPADPDQLDHDLGARRTAVRLQRLHRRLDGERRLRDDRVTALQRKSVVPPRSSGTVKGPRDSALRIRADLPDRFPASPGNRSPNAVAGDAGPFRVELGARRDTCAAQGRLRADDPRTRLEPDAARHGLRRQDGEQLRRGRRRPDSEDFRRLSVTVAVTLALMVAAGLLESALLPR